MCKDFYKQNLISTFIIKHNESLTNVSLQSKKRLLVICQNIFILVIGTVYLEIPEDIFYCLKNCWVNNFYNSFNIYRTSKHIQRTNSFSDIKVWSYWYVKILTAVTWKVVGKLIIFLVFIIKCKRKRPKMKKYYEENIY